MTPLSLSKHIIIINNYSISINITIRINWWLFRPKASEIMSIISDILILYDFHYVISRNIIYNFMMVTRLSTITMIAKLRAVTVDIIYYLLTISLENKEGLKGLRKYRGLSSGNLHLVNYLSRIYKSLFLSRRVFWRILTFKNCTEAFEDYKLLNFKSVSQILDNGWIIQVFLGAHKKQFRLYCSYHYLHDTTILNCARDVKRRNI